MARARHGSAVTQILIELDGQEATASHTRRYLSPLILRSRRELMTDRRPEPDIECDGSRAAAFQKQPAGGWLRYRATLDELCRTT